MLSICESTNFLLVSATVTTSTIEALPMMTPSDVSIARTLFARSASTATDTVSRQSIIVRHRYFLKEFEQFQAWLKFSASLEPLQGILRHLVFGIEPQRSFILFHRIFRLVFVFGELPYPCMGGCRPRVSRPRRRLLRVLPQQALGFSGIFFLQDQCHPTVEVSPRVVRRNPL